VRSCWRRVDVYLLDGASGRADAQNRLEDYTDDYIPSALHRVQELSGADESTSWVTARRGLTLLHAAHHPDSPVRRPDVMATPVDFRHMGPLGEVFASAGWESTPYWTTTQRAAPDHPAGLPLPHTRSARGGSPGYVNLWTSCGATSTWPLTRR